MFYFNAFFFNILWMHMFMRLVSRMVKAMVASSSPIGGSGTLQALGVNIYGFLKRTTHHSKET